jgi:hypothetical protein
LRRAMRRNPALQFQSICLPQGNGLSLARHALKGMPFSLITPVIYKTLH